MRSMIRCVAVKTPFTPLFTTLLAIPSTARPQATAAARAPRGPVWATLSAGRGDLQVNCAICRSTDQTSWAADVTIGGWINARTTLGGELGAW